LLREFTIMVYYLLQLVDHDTLVHVKHNLCLSVFIPLLASIVCFYYIYLSRLLHHGTLMHGKHVIFCLHIVLHNGVFHEQFLAYILTNTQLGFQL